jgi:hypothetical protein
MIQQNDNSAKQEAPRASQTATAMNWQRFMMPAPQIFQNNDEK